MNPVHWNDDTDAALADAAQRFLQEQYRFDMRMQRVPEQRRFDARVWSHMAEMGWCSVAADETLGGLGFRPSSIALLAEAAGQALMTEPFLSCGVIPSRLLAACSASPARDTLLSDALQGHQRIVAHAMQPFSAHGIHQDQVTAQIPWVADADVAQTLLLPIEGAGIYVVPAGSAGLALQPLALLDGRGAAGIALTSCAATLLPEAAPGALSRALAHTRLLACLAIAADSVGVMRGALALTLEYLKTRKQFGVALGHHQVLQHRAVDMYIRLSESETVVRQATRSFQPDGSLDATQIHAAKAVACDNARIVTQEAVQLHGGIGITEEYAISHYLRRARVNEQMYGSTEHHFKAFAMSSRSA